MQPHKFVGHAPSATPKLQDAIFYLQKFTDKDFLDIQELTFDPITEETTVHLIHPNKTITYTADTPLTPALLEEYELGISAAFSNISFMLEELDTLTEEAREPGAAAILAILIHASIPHLEPELAKLVRDHFTPRLPQYLERHWQLLTACGDVTASKSPQLVAC